MKISSGEDPRIPRQPGGENPPEPPREATCLLHISTTSDGPASTTTTGCFSPIRYNTSWQVSVISVCHLAVYPKQTKADVCHRFIRNPNPGHQHPATVRRPIFRHLLLKSDHPRQPSVGLRLYYRMNDTATTLLNHYIFTTHYETIIPLHYYTTILL